MELFRLFGSIMIDDKDALSALKRTEDRAKVTTATMKKIGDSALQVGKTVAVGLGIAATAATALVVKFSDTASKIDDASKRVGMSAENYQKWTYAGKIAGVEAEKLEAAMKKQQTAFADAVGGSKKLQTAYTRLGIDITKVGDSSKAFDLVITKLAEMKDETLRNELANDLFGKSYADLLPLLEEGADGIMRLREEAEELGGVISDENVEAGAEFGDTMDRLKTILGGITNEISIMLLPYFQKFADWIVANKEDIKKFADNVIQGLATVLSKVGDFMSDVVNNKDGAGEAFDKIVWFLGAITAGAMVSAIATHPIFALISAIATLITFKDQFADVYRNMTPGQKLLTQLGALALAVGAVIVAATGGVAAIPIAAGMTALAIAVGAVIAEGEKTKGSGSSWRPESTAEVTANAWQYGSNSINPDAYKTQPSASAEDIASAVKNELKNVTIQLDGKAVGKIVDNRLLTATE